VRQIFFIVGEAQVVSVGDGFQAASDGIEIDVFGDIGVAPDLLAAPADCLLISIFYLL
jgi:hypothetical protein